MQTPHRLGCRPASSVAGRTSAVRHLACPHLRQSHAHGTGFPHHQAPNHRRSRTAPARRLLSTYNCVGRHCAPFRRSARRAAICRCAGSLPTEKVFGTTAAPLPGILATKSGSSPSQSTSISLNESTNRPVNQENRLPALLHHGLASSTS